VARAQPSRGTKVSSDASGRQHSRNGAHGEVPRPADTCSHGRPGSSESAGCRCSPFTRVRSIPQLVTSAPCCRQCQRSRCLTGCWPVPGPPACSFAPIWLPKSDIGRGGTRTAGHPVACDLRVLPSGWPDLNRRPLRPERRKVD